VYAKGSIYLLLLVRKIVGQDTREQCGIQPVGEWVNKTREE
jgi:hypothetical protein